MSAQITNVRIFGAFVLVFFGIAELVPNLPAAAGKEGPAAAAEHEGAAATPVAARVRPAAAVTPRLWAGHQVVTGNRRAPIVGKVETRTETWFLAEIEDTGRGLVIRQRSCRVDIAKTAGVKISMDPETPPRLPVVAAHYRPDGEGTLAAPRWIADWGEQDVDGDGHPGLTLHVEAPFCSGDIRVASRSISRARIRRQDGVIVGRIEVQNRQRILDTSSLCLSMFARDSDDVVSGTFAFVPVDPGATCRSLAEEDWPIEAPEKVSPGQS